MDALAWFPAVAWTAAGLWLLILALPWRPWWPGPRLEGGGVGAARLDEITVLIPARNEAETLGRTLRALWGQGPGLRVVVIDDESTDGTDGVARAGLRGRGCLLRSQPKPQAWSGKLWALEQGRRRVCTPWILLLDADIVLRPNLLTKAYEKARTDGLDLLSLMASPRLEGFWERLLMPAFVYFFKLLYPFRLANKPSPWFAAAAGGFVLIRASVLEQIGGFGALRGALIDDCTLARLCKQAGARTWIGLSRSVRSSRRAESLGALRDMVARTAFTQLGHSFLWLMVCTALMVLTFIVPVLALGASGAMPAGMVALGAMGASYVPILIYYRRSPAWAVLLPLIGGLYLWMTWVSAVRHWRGQGATWRGRRYADPRAGTRMQ